MANTGNTQQQINYGSAANDGQGDPLRTAFIKTDDNFDAIWNAGPVGSNITIVNNTVQSNNVNGNIVLRPNGVGVIQANAAIVPNATNLRDLGTADQRFRAAYIGTGGMSIDGNVTVTGNLTAGNISYTGNVFVGDLQGSVYADDSTIMVDAIDNSMFADSATFGQATIAGNVEANLFIGNGSLLTGIASTYGNANVANYLASDFGAFNSNTIVTIGNIVARALDVANLTHVFPIGIQTNGGGVWSFAGNILRGPQGGSWTSDADTSYFNSPANGFLNLSSLQNGNVVSELFMEHSFIRFFIDNGIDATWQMLADGRTEFPSYIFPYADGNAGEVLKTDGSGNLAWTTDSSDYGNANVATFLAAFGSNTITTTGNISAGNISVSGAVNVTQDIFTKTGTFTGDERGENSVYAGFPTFTVLGSDVIGQFSGNVNQYAQFNFQNGSNGSQASGDYVITADNGNDTTHFLNIGLTGGNWDGTQPNSLNSRLGPNDGYMYVQDGNLAIGVKDGSSTDYIWRFDITGNVTTDGNIIPSANAVYSLGNVTNQWDNLWVANNITTAGNISAGNISTGQGLVQSLDITADGIINAGALNVNSSAVPGATGNITGGNLSVTGNITGNTAGFAIGYRDIPQVSFTGNATIATGDAGKHFYSTQSTDYILTIANNASQGFQVGAAITVVNQGTGNITVAQGSGVTLYLAGNATSGNRTVTTYGMATIMKVATDTWFINGTGVS